MDQYFDRMQQILQRKDLPSRIKFMLEDVVALRNNKVSKSSGFAIDSKTSRPVPGQQDLQAGTRTARSAGRYQDTQGPVPAYFFINQT